MADSVEERGVWLDEPVSRPARTVVAAASIAILVSAAASAIVTMANADRGTWLTTVPGLVAILVALASWSRTPPRAFGRLRWGRWWVGVGVVLLTPADANVLLPIGALVWFVYQRPRLRRAVYATT